MAAIDIEKLQEGILGAAIGLGGNVWEKIQKSTPFFLKGYLQSVAEIAKQRAAGFITAADAKMFTKRAQHLLIQGIADTAQIVLIEVQSFINKLIGMVKDMINRALPIAIL